jgi:hypothetical protein
MANLRSSAYARSSASIGSVRREHEQTMTKSKKRSKPPRQKQKLTSAQRRERKRMFKIIFINGKQKRIPREPRIDGLTVDEFVARNADPIWLVQNEVWVADV